MKKHIFLDWQLGVALLLAPFLLGIYQVVIKGGVWFQLGGVFRFWKMILVSPLGEEIIFRGFLQA